ASLWGYPGPQTGLGPQCATDQHALESSSHRSSPRWRCPPGARPMSIMPNPDLLHSLQRAAAMRGAHKDTQAAGGRQPVRAFAVPWAETVYWGYVHPMRAYNTNISAVPKHKAGGDMHRKWVGFTGMLVAVLLVAALAAQAQPREFRPGFAPD